MEKSTPIQSQSLRLFLLLFFISMITGYILNGYGYSPLPISLLLINGLFTIGLSTFAYRNLKSLFYFIFNWITEDGYLKTIELDFDTPIPEHMQGMATEIEKHNFTKLGAKQLTFKNNLKGRTWVWVDKTKTVLASVVKSPDGKSFAVFETDFMDGFQLGTFYKRPMILNTKMVFTQNITSSIREAHDFHLHQYDEKSARHGQAKVCEILADTTLDVEEQKQQNKQIHLAYIQAFTPSALYSGLGTMGFLLATILAFFDITRAFILMLLTLVALMVFYRIVNQNTPQPINHKSRKALEQ